MSQAVNVLIAGCMKRFGFEYPVESFADAKQKLQDSEAESDSRLFGVTRKADAERFGYMPASLTTQTEPPVVPDSDSAAYQLVLTAGSFAGNRTGDPPDRGTLGGLAIPPWGCHGEAWNAVADDPNGYGTQFGRQLLIQAHARASSDARWRTAVSQWAACLNDRGFHVTDPLNDKGDIERVLEGRDQTAAPSDAEVTLALADIACKEKVGLVRRLNAVVQDYAKQALDDNQLALDEERTRLDHLLKKASRVVKEAQ